MFYLSLGLLPGTFAGCLREHGMEWTVVGKTADCLCKVGTVILVLHYQRSLYFFLSLKWILILERFCCCTVLSKR